MARQRNNKVAREREFTRLLEDARVSFEKVALADRQEERIERIAFARRLRLSQAAFAREIGLDLRTVRAWEGRAKRPVDPATRALFENLRQQMTRDPGLGRRLTVKSALRAVYQRYERSNGNPLHAWQAVQMCMHPEEDLVSLPRWCADYLFKAAEGLLALPEKFSQTECFGSSQVDTARQVSRALGLTRQGWSAFDKLNGDSDKISRRLEFEKAQLEGESFDSSLTAASKYRPEISIDGAKKAVRSGKRLLTHIPEVLDDTGKKR